jgi:hypothetical protein
MNLGQNLIAFAEVNHLLEEQQVLDSCSRGAQTTQ